MIGPDLRSSAFQVLSALAVPENRSRCMIYRGRCMIYRALQRCTYSSGDGGMATLFSFVFVRRTAASSRVLCIIIIAESQRGEVSHSSVP